MLNLDVISLFQSLPQGFQIKGSFLHYWEIFSRGEIFSFRGNFNCGSACFRFFAGINFHGLAFFPFFRGITFGQFAFFRFFAGIDFYRLAFFFFWGNQIYRRTMNWSYFHNKFFAHFNAYTKKHSVKQKLTN